MMNNSIDLIRRFEDIFAEKCSSWIQKVGNATYLVDPIDGVEISAHYGATHSAVALMLLGKSQSNEPLRKRGYELMDSILNRWDESAKLPAFHNDFNNFALCVAEEILPREDVMVKRIREIVLKTPDSNHDTINWLPMRAFVNKKRFQWTSDDNYSFTFKQCLDKIQKATNSDGGIEDRMPKGTSFNLQYDIATVSVLQFLRICGVEKDLSRELGFLLSAVHPDGDVNYQGRGSNQVFAWSGWLYLLSSSGMEKELNKALLFLSGKLEKMLLQDNIFLNDESGKEKRMWWDYHYASVYISHFFFWLVLAERDFCKAKIMPTYHLDNSTGLTIYRGNDFFVAVFNGRNEYLAERGPIVSAVWTRKLGNVFKGSFGPWQGLFGNLHCPKESVFNNYWGPILLTQNTDLHKNRLLRKLLPKLRTKSSLKMQLALSNIKVKESAGFIDICFEHNRGCSLNLPVFVSSKYIPVVYDDNDVLSISKDFLIQNQYGVLSVYRSSPSTNNISIVRIPK